MSEKHACPLFYNVKACITELHHDQREILKKIIEEQGGGRVMKELSSACDVLITLVSVYLIDRTNHEDSARNMSGQSSGGSALLLSNGFMIRFLQTDYFHQNSLPRRLQSIVKFHFH